MRTYLVTGGNRGIGLALVREIIARGDKVIATVREPGKVSEVAKLGATVHVLEADKPASIDALAKALAGVPIDVLINNAGVSDEDRAVGKLNMEAFERVFRTNTFAPALIAQAMLPNLRLGKSKQVLNISSQLGSIAGATAGFSYAYNASKAALNMITARMAKDLAGEGFTVVSFCPGWNKTDMGGAQAPLDPAVSMKQLLDVAQKLTPAQSGAYLRHTGEAIAW
ncbi:MAG: SDR family oxidoreductase [Phycisphaerae bacterium]|jgi:NAD(P)-dependent dehydrogenase (short-subunit alcohol dehydrogenase family)